MYAYRQMSLEERRAVLQERRERGFPLHAPPHFYGIEGWYLISTACHEHRPIFDSPDELSWLADEILTALTDVGLEYTAWVFLPNHYHVLLRTEDIAIVSECLRLRHSRVSTKINSRHKQRGRQVWYRFSDRQIRSERHYWATVNYLHNNPVKHGYVDDMMDWVWSSVHWYEETKGRDWLTRIWREYPVDQYGRGWDD